MPTMHDSNEGQTQHMTDTQKAMREKSLSEYREELERESGYVLSEEMENAYRDGWEDATAKSAEKMARLEAENIQLQDKIVNMVRIVERDYQAKLAAAELSNKQLREEFTELVKAVKFEVNEKGAGGFLLARLADAKYALAQQPSTEALDAYVAKLNKWQPIETAPKDGTVIDVWMDEVGRVTVYWGLPPHTCGEMGQYCDSDWHSNQESGWVDAVFLERMSGKTFTRWMPLPPAPKE